MATQVTTGLLANNAVTDAKLHADFTATTQSASDNSTSVATTAYVTTAIANLADSAPSTLNTLNELAAALGDDANFSTTVTNSIATKAPLASPTFTSNINGGDGVELRLGNSQDILFKHHSAGYGHLENKTGTFYIDSETFDIRTDIDNAGLAIGIDANQRVGINQTPSGTNFSLQVTGQQTDGTDARVAYFKGYGTHTSIGSTGPTVVVQNANTTANNYAKLSFESGNAGETVSINAQNIDHTNHYGDMAFNTRGSDGYSEKMRITSNGNIGMGGETNPQHKLAVELNSGEIAMFGGQGTNNAGAYCGIGLGQVLNNDTTYQKVSIFAEGTASGYYRQNFHIAVDTAQDSGTAVLADSKFKIDGSTGATTIGNANDVTDHYVLKVQSNHGLGEQGSHNSTYYHHNTDRSINYFSKRCEASGGFHTYSDERLKEEITPVTGALDSVAKMNGVTFKWKNADERGGGFTGKHFGVTAQNMLEVDPELPELNKDPLYNIKEDVNEHDEYYTMDYSRLSPYFIEAIKELKTKLEAAEARITELEG